MLIAKLLGSLRSIKKVRNAMEPIYESSYMGFWIKIFKTHIEYKAARVEAIPINQIASVQCGMKIFGIEEKKVVIETSGGKKHSVPVSNPQEVKNKIYEQIGA